ncbi:MAG: sugar phosphate isomerase/epimerase [Clostridia bacterium]|nr:sugar phosphate isomerase/epimerase [Clostridia bacterium]
MAKIILSGFFDEHSDSFDGQLEAMKGYGVKNVEIRHVDKKNVSILTKEEVAEVKAKLDNFGFGVSSIGSPLGKIKLDGDIDAHMETARRTFETANTLGAEYIRMFSFYAPDGKDITKMRSEVIDALGRMLDIAKEHGVTLCHENEAEIYGATPERCLDLLNEFGGELGCVFDMGNFVLEQEEPVAAYKMLRDHIRYFHIKDALYEGAIVPPGCGNAKIGEILSEHKAYAKKDFFISLEPHLQLFSGLNALVGRAFENPYKYNDAQSAFTDAYNKLLELI